MQQPEGPKSKKAKAKATDDIRCYKCHEVVDANNPNNHIMITVPLGSKHVNRYYHPACAKRAWQ